MEGPDAMNESYQKSNIEQQMVVIDLPRGGTPS